MKEMSKKCSIDQRFISKEITSQKIHTLAVHFFKSNPEFSFFGPNIGIKFSGYYIYQRNFNLKIGPNCWDSISFDFNPEIAS